jgi:hypothetical protein
MPTVVIGNNTGDDYSGTEDAQIKESSPTYTYGNRITMEITKYASGDHTNTLLRFKGLSNLPSGITVSASAINLYCASHSSGSRTATAKRLLRDWVEGWGDSISHDSDTPNMCCWDEYGDGNSWATAGGLSDGNDRSSTSSGTMAMDGTGYKELTGSQLNTDIQNGYNQWHLERTDGEDDSTWDTFTSSEGTDGQRPYLSVTYTESGGTGNSYYYQQQQM